ncbi:MAG: glycosyltransferase [Candidatus Aminicenantes bacterium]|nr:glycosyltransferase [Candidatus Aminicenantes bacterium]
MWEETLDELEIEGRPRRSVMSHPWLKDRIDQIIVFAIIICSALILISALKLHLFAYWADFLRSSKFLRIATYPLLFSAVSVFSALALQTFLWAKYKPMKVLREEDTPWPTVTVIMAALNEQDLVTRAIDSVFAGNYPKDKLELICVNDGSTDLTLTYMQRARQKYGDRLKVISFRKNLGKRKALYVGIKSAKGDVVVTFDSDSLLGRSALRNIVVPLIQDPRTVCVAGRVAVLNEKQNFLTRMLSVRYSVAFDYGRAYQSTFGTVVCCPGALTAYNKPMVAALMPEFLSQKFMDEPCNHGEDRALTTLILRTGQYVRYQSNAVVYTTVPTTFNGMNKMYLRWTRSYVRESIFQARFVFTRYREKNRILPIIDFIFLNFLHPFHLFSLGLVLYSFAVNPLFMLRHTAFLVILSFILSLFYLRTNKSVAFLYGIPYGLITAFLLWWIVPFSVLTMKNQKWLTR